ncbi:hypothetical protein [Novosphingobium sp.]|uniref:hypothetical protein n=1 Tax=Novosphingobium sp. TaxID=1874826 RepID=UPI0025E0483D|nr:hypothetical protein [Novosphingobium sp.]
MSLSARRLRSIGWLALLAVCATLVLVLTLRVNALRSQVRREENRIVALREETMYLQTEFETRASQQQLKAWNDVDFGYVAPGAGQYLENERQLAMLGKPAGPDAPAPVRLAELGDSANGLSGDAASTSGTAAAAYSGPSFPAMVSPLTGKPSGRAVRSDAVMRAPTGERLLATDDVDASGQAGSRADHAAATAALGERLGHVDLGGPGKAVRKPAHKPPAKSKANPDAAKTSKVKPQKLKAPKPKAAKPKLAKAKPASAGHKPKTHSTEKPA